MVGVPLPELAGVTHRYVEVRGARLHVAEMGSGPPVLLLHGWPQHWWCWHAVMERLAGDARLIVPDLRGSGWSEATPSGYEKHELAEDLIGLLDALELDRVALVGHDWGGVVGTLACIEHPERFSKYLALNTGHPFVKVDGQGALHMWRFAYQWLLASPWVGSRVAATPGFIEFMLNSGSRNRRPVLASADTYTATLREPERARASQLMYRTFTLKDLPSWMRGAYRGRRLTVPTLWVHGLDDVVIRPHLVEPLRDFADEVEIEYVPGVGHFIGEEAPDLVAARAREFFALGAAAPVS